MLPLIFTRKLRPMIIGSSSVWLMLAGMIARPRAISSRTNSGVISSGCWRRSCGRRAAGQQAGGAGLLQLHVFADGDVFHLGGDDAFARVVHLADVGPGLGAARVVDVGEAQLGQLGSARRSWPKWSSGRQALGVATVVDPGRAHIAQAFAHVDDDVGVGVRAGGVVDQ
jgi:hypothetical protein